MSPRFCPAPPGGTVPVVVPGDLVLVDKPGLVIWAGAVTVYPGGFEFTVSLLFDVRRIEVLADFVLAVPPRGRETWIAVRFCDGRYQEADLNANTPRGQPQGPDLTMQHGLGSWTEGWNTSRWWVSPLPPPGPVELEVHLNGEASPTGTGNLDGTALVGAAASAEVLWPDVPQE
jgi:hypothetical protein